MSTQAGQLTEEQKSKLKHLNPDQIERLQQDPTYWQPAKIKASRDTPIGYELEPEVFTATEDKLKLYLGWPNSISRHTDYADAWHTGMPRPVVMANQVAEILGRMLIKFFGEGYLGGHLEWVSLHVPFCDDTFTCHMVVKDKVVEGDKMRISLDHWVDNQRGEKALVGTASGMVD
ncbi:MaoC family dehydratase [Chloroflexota bacterium]